MFSIHRKEQWDLGCKPLVCVHKKDACSSERIFCLWISGVQIGAKVILFPWAKEPLAAQ